jgi:hypothetical protein
MVYAKTILWAMGFVAAFDKVVPSKSEDRRQSVGATVKFLRRKEAK